ncbi:MAG: hypothetical protein KBS81_11140 [Spirochaetales bacterium]|nr:hypothetical protein [Candidatus Physcosoma equi]
MFPGRIIIPKEVYDELSYPGVNRVKGLKTQIDAMIRTKDVSIETIMVDTKIYELYRKLTCIPDPGHKAIGRGEAACIALAKEKQGILASNNLRDISDYVEEYHLTHMTTGDIMKLALDSGFLTEDQGNTIWSNMIARRRRLGYPSFSDYLKDHQRPDEPS